MTYFGFLAIFLGIPILALSLAAWLDARKNADKRAVDYPYNPYIVLAAHILVALVWTTPWDNYLVAAGVWWYDPNLVTGITLGWVPIEEYTFFILQPIMTGLWLLFWMPRIRPSQVSGWQSRTARWISAAAALLVGFASLVVLLMGWKPGTYLALQGVWIALPFLVQFIFGGGILLRYWRVIIIGLVPTTLYLAAADALAISSGTWTIDPEQSLNLYIFGILPIKEFTFFLFTNALVVFGMSLVLAKESQARLAEMISSGKRIYNKITKRSDRPGVRRSTPWIAGEPLERGR